MAYIRHRTTKAGQVSTALVEAHRDKHGRPRQRLLANLHGETSILKALAKLIVMKDVLYTERGELAPQVADIVSREQEGKLTRDELRVVRRYLKIENTLVALQKDGDVINQHCTATPDELEGAVQAHAQEAGNTFRTVLGRTFVHHLELKEAKAKFRRLTT